jgi:hypothetical protein
MVPDKLPADISRYAFEGQNVFVKFYGARLSSRLKLKPRLRGWPSLRSKELSWRDSELRRRRAE